MEGKMNCAIYYGVKDVRMEQRDIPQIGDNDVLVKILRAGICGSDTGSYLHGGEPYGVFSGQQFGHEMVGKIVERGKDVDENIHLEDIVFVDPMRAHRSGSFKADMTGAFSEYVKVEDAKINENIYILDKNINLDSAALIEPVSVGTQGAICLEPKKDSKVVILGAGTIGLSAAAGLIARGMKNVVVVDMVDWRLEKAKQLGAMTINTKEGDLKEQLINIFGEAPTAALNPADIEPDLLQKVMEFVQKSGISLGSKLPDVDYFVDAAGAVSLLQECFNMGKYGTQYSIVAVYGKEIPLNGSMFIMNQALIRGSKGYNTNTILEVIDHIEKKKTPIETIITKKFAHKDFPQAIKEASDTTQNIKVIIDYEM